MQENFERPFTSIHYENMPIQIYETFYHQNIKKNRIKNSDIFHISAQDDPCFWAKIWKIMYTPVNPSFTIYKWGLNGSNYIGMLSWWDDKKAPANYKCRKDDTKKIHNHWTRPLRAIKRTKQKYKRYNTQFAGTVITPRITKALLSSMDKCSYYLKEVCC